jgi:NAD+ synthase (glutamine-hydrolysing)
MSETSHPFFDMHEHGFVRVATATPCCRPADVGFNTAGVLAEAMKAHEAGADLVVFPELTLSSYAIDDLLLQDALLGRVEEAVAEVVAASEQLTPVLVVGAPLRRGGKLYNCAVVIAQGELLGVVPKSFLPNYREF